MTGSSCASQCATGTYVLCGSASDCPSGDTCGFGFAIPGIPQFCINPEAGIPGYDGGRFGRGDAGAGETGTGDDGGTATEAGSGEASLAVDGATE
jgi:hypothetical protein